MAERALKPITGKRTGLEHQNSDQRPVLSLADEELLSLADRLTYSELLEQIKKNDNIGFSDGKVFMAEARKFFFSHRPEDMPLADAPNRGRRCVEVAALLYYNANQVHKNFWPYTLQKFKSDMIVSMLLHQEEWPPRSINEKWFRKKGLYLVLTPSMTGFRKVYVTKAESILAIDEHEKYAGGGSWEFLPFATDETYQFLKQQLSLRSAADCLVMLINIAKIGGIQSLWWPNKYVPRQVYEKLKLNEEIDGH